MSKGSGLPGVKSLGFLWLAGTGEYGGGKCVVWNGKAVIPTLASAFAYLQFPSS